MAFGLVVNKPAEIDQECAGCMDIITEGSLCFHMVPNPFEHGFIAKSYYLCSACREFMKDNPMLLRRGFVKGEIGCIRKEVR